MNTSKQKFIARLNEDSIKHKKEYHEVAFKMELAKIVIEYIKANNLNKGQMASILEVGGTRLSKILKAELNLSIDSIADILARIDYQKDFTVKNIAKPIIKTERTYCLPNSSLDNIYVTVDDKERLLTYQGKQ